MAYLDYDLLSSCYDELYGDEQRRKYDRVDKLCGGITGVILDAGCGTALLLNYLRTHNKDYYDFYVGVDISLGMLKIAKARKDSASDFILADIHNLPFRDKCIDTTLSITVVHHLNHVRALYELKRVTRALIVITQRKGLDNRILEGKKIEFEKENIYVIKP